MAVVNDAASESVGDATLENVACETKLASEMVEKLAVRDACWKYNAVGGAPSSTSSSACGMVGEGTLDWVGVADSMKMAGRGREDVSMGVSVGGPEEGEVAAGERSEERDSASRGGLDDSRGGEWEGAAGEVGEERFDPPRRGLDSCVETELERRPLVGEERWIDGVGVSLREGPSPSKAGGGSAPLGEGSAILVKDGTSENDARSVAESPQRFPTRDEADLLGRQACAREDERGRDQRVREGCRDGKRRDGH